MKKLVICGLIAAVLLLGLCACEANSQDPVLQTVSPIVDPIPQPEPDPQPIELDDVSFESGKYTADDLVYEFDKDAKRIRLLQYSYYSDYVIGRPAGLYSGVVEYKKSVYGDECVYFKDNTYNYDYYLTIKDEKPTIYIVTSTGYRSTTLRMLGEGFIEPENGTYVSDNKEQTVNGVKEEFYIFFVLTDTKASIYVSDNNTSYSGEPLHTIEDYKALFVSGYLRIKIPHENGEYYCSITFKESEVSFVNSYEQAGDYSCSGKLTKVS